MPLFAAALIAGGTYLASRQASKAAKSAASTQKAATDAAIAEQQREFNKILDLYAPYRQAGYNALSQYQQRIYGGPEVPTPDKVPELQKDWGYNFLVQDPSYQFRFNEGLRALRRASAGSRMLNSGNLLAAAQEYGQNMASQEYANAFRRALQKYEEELNRYRLNEAMKTGYYGFKQNKYDTEMNRLAALARIGQTTNNALAGLGSSMASDIGRFGILGAQGMGAATLAGANINANLMNNLAYTLGRTGVLNNLTNPWANPLIGGPRKL